MPDQSLRHSQLIDFEHAAAGHDGLRSDKMGSLLVKPCKQAEISFYETTVNHPDFQYYLPQFYGTLAVKPSASPTTTAIHAYPHAQTLHTADAAIAKPIVATASAHSRTASQNKHLLEAASAASIPEAWVPSGGAAIVAENNIVLENVADGFDKPNVLDVKLGRRLWADDAPTAKRQRLDKTSQETTSGSLGFRIAGMKTWIGTDAGICCDASNGYRKYDKSYGRGFTVDTVRKGFEEYFFMPRAGVTTSLGYKIIRRFLYDLRELQKVLQRKESRMYSSSLLFVYEGRGDRLKQKLDLTENLPPAMPDELPCSKLPIEPTREPDGVVDDETCLDVDEGVSSASEEEVPKVHALKVIDFAHAGWTPGHGPDENMLFGIQNVIRILEDLLASQ
ncbi:MAG: hypothetical protein LQ340_006370 [Diploschistes diacapsis]|nr:MAG: hypothetical protein LQ340_006370 [Diploschistes diacapsis]